VHSDLVPAAATRQRGVFTARQALEEGWTPRQITRRLRNGAWVRIAGRGLARHDHERSGTAVAWAIRLTLPSAVVSHATAAVLHEFPVRGRVAAQACLPRKSGRSATITTFEHAVDAGDLGRFDSTIPVTLARRTATDCLATLPYDKARSLVAWLVTREVVTRDHLVEAVGRYRRHPGAEQLGRLIDLTRWGALSSAEDLCHTVLDRGGVHGWTANVPISDAEGIILVADVAFDAERVVIEVDGWSTHRERAAFERDRRAQTRLAATGWVVIRVTWRELVDSPERFLTLLRRTLNRRRPRVDR
jgi:hypothetical protein